MSYWDQITETGETRGAVALRLRRENGFSNSEIAARLGKTTTGAVGGFLWRHKLTMSTTAKKYRRTSKAKEFAPIEATEPLDVEPDSEVGTGKPILIRKKGRLVANDKLTPDCCRWPIGDPQHRDFHFCGKKIVSPLSSYCEPHARRSVKGSEPHFTAAANVIAIKRPVFEPA